MTTVAGARAGSRVELFAQIRRDCRDDGLSVRALAKRHRVHRRTVRQALISAQPPPPAPRRWRSRKIDPFVEAIDDMLRADRDAPRKQRHTARRILARLIDEHDAADLLSYSTLRDYVAKRRSEIAAETGDHLVEALVPQTHEPGREAEVDFAELYVDLPEGRTKCFLFTMRLSMSGKAVHLGLCDPIPGSIPRRSPRGVRRIRRRPHRPHPLRQFEIRRDAGALR